MSFFGRVKLLKKNNRRRRKWLWIKFTSLLLICLFIYSLSSDSISENRNAVATSGTQSNLLSRIPSDEAREIFLKKEFYCGEELRSLGHYDESEIRQLMEDYPDWKLMEDQSGEIVFVKQIEDLSEHCKETAFFGVDGEGRLSLFEGNPDQNQVLRTFFQLNIEYLESSLPQDAIDQLYQGIRVHDAAEYNSVLSTFSSYADQL